MPEVVVAMHMTSPENNNVLREIISTQVSTMPIEENIFESDSSSIYHQSHIYALHGPSKETCSRAVALSQKLPASMTPNQSIRNTRRQQNTFHALCYWSNIQVHHVLPTACSPLPRPCAASNTPSPPRLSFPLMGPMSFPQVFIDCSLSLRL